MQVKDIMSKQVQTVSPTASLAYAAQLMKSENIGLLPIIENGKALGVVTDRDLVVRALADNVEMDKATVKDVMTKHPVGLNEVEELEHAFELMENQHIGRLLVYNNDGVITGVLSASDLAIAIEGGFRSGQLAKVLAKTHQARTGRQSLVHR
jgi:CBS domain-containing protein